MNGEKKGVIAASLAYIIFGLSYLFSKIALNITEPAILLCARFSITFVILNILVLTGIMKLNLRGKNLIPPILVGLLQPVLYFILENYGLKYTNTSFTGLLSAISPIFTAILGALILKERPTRKQWVFICISLLGVLMVSLKSGSGNNTVLGCLCLIGAYLSGSFYSLLIRRLSDRFTPFELTYVMFSVGFVFFAGMAFFQYRAETVPMLISAVNNSRFIIAILYLGGVASVGAYLLANYSLSKLPVARSTIFANLSTVVSILSGVIIMHDSFTLISVIATILILLGVWGTNAVK
ncbi:MAG: DMT family transporter [Eubacteriales bacterium]